MLYGSRQSGKQKQPKAIGTPQGRNTLISLLICAILGMVLSRVLPFLITKLQPTMRAEDAEEMGVLMALGISGGVLVARLLKPKPRVSPLRRELLKEQEKSDGR